MAIISRLSDNELRVFLNPLFAVMATDSYKLGHRAQYPPLTTEVYSNFTPRSYEHFKSKIPSDLEHLSDNKIVWFGMQGAIIDLLNLWNEFFSSDWQLLDNSIKDALAPFVGPNGFDTAPFKALHDLGYLPIEVRSLLEGTLVPVGVPCFTIRNTLPEFFWLTNYLETWLSASLWKPSTSATIARLYGRILSSAALMTGSSVDFVQWQGHDFSVRGMAGMEDAALSGTGHLVAFRGTDNLPAVMRARTHYDGNKTFVGGSVPASEHSIICAGGKESEADTFRRLLTTYPNGVVSIVSDTWDFWHVITVMAAELKPLIMARGPDNIGLCKTVFRPDSGDPVKVIVGDPDAPEGSPQRKGAVECLAETFGTTTNAQGYRTLDPHVGLIYGDSITPDRAYRILEGLRAKGYAADNVVFGVGSFTYVYNTRDTLGFAMKATSVVIDGERRAIFKDPKTDNGTKKSARGLLKVISVDGELKLLQDVSEYDAFYSSDNELKLVMLDGKLTKGTSLAEIRHRLGFIAD
jgi:nicotinamide phosphoribosyltransferase